jgi:hypothetical protein
MNGLTKYILFVFTKNDNPQEFTEQIAEELSVISDAPKINYYYGPESSVFTISTLDSYVDVRDYVDMILDITGITYILLPYTPDNMSYNLSPQVSNHLFNDGVCDYMSGNNEDKDSSVRNMLRNHIKEEFFLDFSKFDDEDDDDDDFFGTSDMIKFKCQKIKPTFDELFDKIADSGIGSLTPEELVTLNQYSK